ncbi:MAG TPA: FMN-binding protein [Clostridiales bacterium]|nr:FMN-binding protein [Clostridiales bacterium]
MVANHNLEVDTVSGVTYSSNVIRAAVYRALSND